MLNPKKTIPTLATALLALSGCGDSNGGGGGGGAGGDGGNGGVGGGEPEPTAFEAWCTFREQCRDEGDIPAPLPPVCQQDAELPEGCEESLESYFQCWTEQECDTLRDDPYACVDEADIADIQRCLL